MSYEQLTLSEFISKYSTIEACLDAIIVNRWPNGFVCPKCQNKGGNRLKNRRAFQCTNCYSQTSITANTVFHQAKLPLPQWFLAIYFVAANKQGISSISLAKHIGCSHQTAWHILHKLRNAMKERDAKYYLSGNITVDEGYLGSCASGSSAQGRSTNIKSAVVVAVEKVAENTTGNVHVQPVAHVRAKDLHEVVMDKIKVGSTLRTDGWSGYCGISKYGYIHQVEKSAKGKESTEQFPLVHRIISNLRSWMLGTFRNFCQRHLELYTAEYSYKTNRRNRTSKERRDNIREATLAERLIGAASIGSWISWNEITGKSALTACS